MDGSLNFVAEPENKAVALGFEYFLEEINANYISGFSSLKILKEPFRNAFIGIRFSAFSAFYDVVNEHIKRLFDTGFIQYYRRERTRRTFISKADEIIGPQVLTMEHLGVGFMFCVIPLAIAAVLLAVEILIPQIKISFRKFSLFCAVRAFLRSREN